MTVVAWVKIVTKNTGRIILFGSGHTGNTGVLLRVDHNSEGTTASARVITTGYRYEVFKEQVVKDMFSYWTHVALVWNDEGNHLRLIPRITSSVQAFFIL